MEKKYDNKSERILHNEKIRQQTIDQMNRDMRAYAISQKLEYERVSKWEDNEELRRECGL